jgi:hypothetical protein
MGIRVNVARKRASGGLTSTSLLTLSTDVTTADEKNAEMGILRHERGVAALNAFPTSGNMLSHQAGRLLQFKTQPMWAYGCGSSRRNAPFRTKHVVSYNDTLCMLIMLPSVLYDADSITQRIRPPISPCANPRIFLRPSPLSVSSVATSAPAPLIAAPCRE